MSHDHLVAGLLVFPRGAVQSWRETRVDTGAHAWPAGFGASSRGRGVTVALVLEALAAADRGERLVDITTSSTRVHVRALLESSQLGSHGRPLVASFMAAHELGAAGLLTILPVQDGGRVPTWALSVGGPRPPRLTRQTGAARKQLETSAEVAKARRWVARAEKRLLGEMGASSTAAVPDIPTAPSTATETDDLLRRIHASTPASSADRPNMSMSARAAAWANGPARVLRELSAPAAIERVEVALRAAVGAAPFAALPYREASFAQWLAVALAVLRWEPTAQLVDDLATSHPDAELKHAVAAARHLASRRRHELA